MPKNAVGRRGGLQDPYIEEREHYKSLTKIVITAMTVIGGVGAIVAGFTFKDVTEAREFQQKLNDRAQQSVDQTKTDAKQTIGLLQAQVADLKVETQKILQQTSNQAIVEISKIEEIAKNQAIKRVEEILEKGNLETYIDSIARRELHTKAKAIVSEEFARRQQLELQKIDKSIDAIDGSIDLRNDRALDVLKSSNLDFNESQIDKLWKLLDGEMDNAVLRDELCLLLAKKPFPNKERLVKDRLLADASSRFGANVHFFKFIASLNELDEQFYINLLSTDRKYSTLFAIINDGKFERKDFVRRILNSKAIIDWYFTHKDKEFIKAEKIAIDNTVRFVVESHEYQISYYVKAIETLN